MLPDNTQNQSKIPSENDFDAYSTDDVEEVNNLLTGLYYKPVEILLIESPSLFYATLPEWKFLRKRFCKTLSKYYSGKEPDDIKWTVNSICAVHSLVDDEFYRAIITDVQNDNTYTVFMKDIGRKETIPAQNLYKLEESFSTHFQLSIPCSLTGIKPAGDSNNWSHSAIDYFRHLVRKYRSLQMTRMGEIVDMVIPVKLISSTQVENGPLELPTERRVCLNKLMVAKGLAFLDKDTEVDEMSAIIKKSINSPLQSDDDVSSDEEQHSVIEIWIPAPRFESKQFKAWVTYVDHNGHIYLQTETARNRVNEMVRTYNRHFKATCPEPPRNWKPGQMVTAQYHLDKNFCRGTVMDVVPGGNILVKLVDFGNEEEVRHEELRSEVLYTNVPILCNEVSLANVVPKTEDQKWPIPVLDTLHILTVDKEFEVTVVTEGSKTEVPSVILRKGNITVNNEANNFIWDKTAVKIINEKSSDVDDDSVVIEGEIEENIKAIEQDFALWKENLGAPKPTELLVSSYKQIELDPTQLQFEAAVVSILDYNDITIETEFFEKMIKETATEFQNLMQEIHKNGSNQPVVKTLYKGYPCIAPYVQDNLWYRAEIFDKGSTEDSMQVLFVDYGNVEAVPIKDIREIQHTWLDFPVQILRCELVNVELGKNADPEEVCKALAEVLDKKMLVKVKSFKPKLEIYLYNANTGALAFQSLLDNGSLRMTEP